MISVPKSDIEFIFNMLGQKLSNSGGSSTVKLNKSGKPKKQNSNKGKPTCHGDFVKMICEKFKGEIAAFKAENPEQKGAHLVFAGNYKKENPDEFAAFEAEWKEAHPKDAESSNASVAPSDVEEATEKKRPPMSDEKKAKMKAGSEASAAAKKAAKAGAPEAAPEPEPEAKKKAVRTAKKATPAITTPVVAPIEAAAPELLPFKMGVVTYLRMGTKRPDGNHLWASGHIWNSKNGAKGPYIGELQDHGELNEEATEPVV
jgi:hypothetical protein